MSSVIYIPLINAPCTAGLYTETVPVITHTC